MKNQAPIKRHPAIVSFSKDHHFGLLLVWKIRQGLNKAVNPERISNYVIFFFKADLEKHFKDEEELLFSKLPAEDVLRNQAEGDHRAIYKLVAAIEKKKDDTVLLNKLADVLEKHIRFEERELFNHLQDNIKADDLEAIANGFPGCSKAIDEKWEDVFWEIKKNKMDIPHKCSNQKRIVIVGAGFAGLTLAKKLSPEYFQVILIDKNNYHQFQPLLYQVATSGLEPSSISFPLRKIFQQKRNIFIRMSQVTAVSPETKMVHTDIGDLEYDYLVLAQGATTNYFNNDRLQKNAYSMKSVSEALLLRNTLLQNYEMALNAENTEQRSSLLNVVIVGGGPTGVELAGAIAEMKKKILPKDYVEINFGHMHIHLLEAAPRLLNGMSTQSGNTVVEYLNGLGVEIQTNTAVKDYDGETVSLSNGKTIHSRCLIWAAGVKGVSIPGIPTGSVAANNRILVNQYNLVNDLSGVYAIGDIALMQDKLLPKGHPQVAQVAIQQAKLLAGNLQKMESGKPLIAFKYKDKGSLATVGRNLALAEIGKLKLKGFIAWFVWMLVHLMSIIGIKNRLFVLINWMWQYITYDQSLRLIIRPSDKKKEIKLYETNTDHFFGNKSFAGL